MASPRRVVSAGGMVEFSNNSTNPYESPRISSSSRIRWPRYWAFVLAVSFILGTAFGGIISYGIGYIDGYQHCARKPLMPDDP